MGRAFFYNQQIRKAGHRRNIALGDARLDRRNGEQTKSRMRLCCSGFEIAVERKLLSLVDKWNENYPEYVEEKEIVPGAVRPKGRQRAHVRGSFKGISMVLPGARFFTSRTTLTSTDRSLRGRWTVRYPLPKRIVQNRTYPSSGMRISISIASGRQAMDYRAREFMRTFSAGNGKKRSQKKEYARRVDAFSILFRKA